LSIMEYRTGSVAYFAGATLALVVGVTTAALHYPGGFDWVYMVISKLGSNTHNPIGGQWLAASLLAAVVLLWPVVRHLEQRDGRRGGRRAPIVALRVALVGGVLLALEGLRLVDYSGLHRKGHEIIALVTFFGLYGGVLGLYAQRIRRSAISPVPALIVILPLGAAAASQLTLYLGQRELGWVNTSWRDMGIPFWLSFAFWQWSAIALLGLGMGYLVLAGGGERSPTASVDGSAERSRDGLRGDCRPTASARAAAPRTPGGTAGGHRG
jgi:hypothetical protein